MVATSGAKTVTFTATGVSSGTTGGTTTGTLTPKQVVLVSGAGQSGTIGQPLGAPVVVKVLDAGGNTVSGATLTWTTAATNGTGSYSSPISSVSDANGQATTTWILGAKVGQQTIKARIAGVDSVSVNATATLGSSGAILIDNGNNQSASTGALLPTRLRVLVVDQNGNVAEGARITWTVQGGGGTVSKSNDTTSAAGLDSVDDAGRRVSVHQHLAGDQAHVAGKRRLEQRLHRGLVDGAEHQCAGCAVA